MTEVPVTRSLTAVLRRSIEQRTPLQLLVGAVGAAITGPDSGAYVNVVIDGVTVKVPFLRGVVTGSPGDAAYVLATPDFLLFLGTVRR